LTGSGTPILKDLRGKIRESGKNEIAVSARRDEGYST
jgi:hypothetical protein